MTAALIAAVWLALLGLFLCPFVVSARADRNAPTPPNPHTRDDYEEAA